MSNDEKKGGKGFFKRLFGGSENDLSQDDEPSEKMDAPPQKSTGTREDLPAPPPKDEEAAIAAGRTTRKETGETETEEEKAEKPEREPEPETDVPPPGEKRRNWFLRLTSGLKKTSDQLGDNIGAVFTRKKLDARTLEELEDVLIQADLGIDTALAITQALEKDRFEREISTKDVKKVLAREVEKTLEPVASPLVIDEQARPFVILMVGVNGSGKTTTIGKLAEKYCREGKNVMLAAGDTFRAAAIEQLTVWGKRAGCEVISRPPGSDASGLAYDALERARNSNTDILIIDTAGRLQNRDELMAELEKIVRVIKKLDPDAPHATLLTLDATTGQNALQQVEIFGQRAGVTGLVMTKLDGTARGGILVAIAKKHPLPVHYVGVGEGADDLEPFSPGDFAMAITGTGE